MNDRIKELAEQAAFRQFVMPKSNVSSALEGYNGTFTEKEAIEKFAELIVRECAKVCRDQTNEYAMELDRENCASAIEEHFGVEE